MGRNPLLDILAALVPASEREELIRRYGAEPFVWSAVLGVGEFYGGGKLLLANALTYFRTVTDALATQVMDMDPRQFGSPDNRLAIFWSGSLVWLAWALQPMTWLLFSIPVVGVLRLVAFGVSHDAVGEPLVWAGVRTAQAVRRWIEKLQRRRRFGPLRPDRLLRSRRGGLIVLSCRPKPDWNERITIEIGEGFYRLKSVEERRDGAWWAYAHRLEEAHPNEIFRGLVRYEPPN